MKKLGPLFLAFDCGIVAVVAIASKGAWSTMFTVIAVIFGLGSILTAFFEPKRLKRITDFFRCRRPDLN